MDNQKEQDGQQRRSNYCSCDKYEFTTGDGYACSTCKHCNKEPLPPQFMLQIIYNQKQQSKLYKLINTITTCLYH